MWGEIALFCHEYVFSVRRSLLLDPDVTYLQTFAVLASIPNNSCRCIMYVFLKTNTTSFLPALLYEVFFGANLWTTNFYLIRFMRYHFKSQTTHGPHMSHTDSWKALTKRWSISCASRQFHLWCTEVSIISLCYDAHVFPFVFCSSAVALVSCGRNCLQVAFSITVELIRPKRRWKRTGA